MSDVPAGQMNEGGHPAPEPQTTTLAELFSMDPRHMADSHIDIIILRYREARAQYNLGAKAPGSTKTLAKKDAKDKVSAIDLKALGLLDDL